MKKVYIHASLTFGGGIGAVTKNLIEEELLKKNIVYICGPQKEKIDDINSYFDNKCHTVVINKRKSRIPNVVRGTNLLKIYKKIKEKYPSYQIVLLCHAPGIVGFFGKIPQDTFLVLHGHIYEDDKKITRLFYRALFSKISRKCVFISCSKECHVYYKDNYSITSTVIQNGVKQRCNKHIRRTNQFNIGFVGPLCDHKGYKYILDAINYLNAEKCMISIIFAGANLDKFDFSSIKSPHITVKYLGLVNDLSSKMSELFDIIILPSLMEGLPMSILESISYSIPVLATHVGGIPEIIEDGVNGFFIKRDGEDIAEKIRRCMDTECYSQLQKGCCASYEANFNAKRMNGQYEDLFNKVLGEAT